MKKIYTLLFILSSFFVFSQAPSNDDCVNATPIVIPASGNICFSGSNATATSDNTTNACDTGAAGNEVWYTYTTTGSQNTITVTPSGATPASALVISLTSAVCTAGTYNTCNAATGAGTATTVFSFAVGTQVWFSIETNGTNGTFNVCVTSVTPPAGAGEGCATAQNICNKASLNYAAYSHSGSGATIGCAYDVFGNPANATVQSDIWIKFTVGVTGTLEWDAIPLNTTQQEWDWSLHDLGVGGTCPGTEISCNYYTNGTGSRGFGMVPGGPGPGTGSGTAFSDYNPPLTVTAGRTYAILIDKYNRNQTTGPNDGLGFNLTWGGTFEIAPASKFTVSPKQACGSLTAAFVNNSGSGITSYLWNFGDGTTSTAVTPPNHTYSTPGNYLISLTTTSTTGCTNSSSQVVSISAPVVTVTAASPSICLGASTVLNGDINVTSLLSPITFSQTVNTVIPNNNPAGITSTINASGIYPANISNNTIVSVCLDILHPKDNQLNITLISPCGVSIDLSSGNGGTLDNYTNTCFSSSATTPVTAGTAPFSGSFTPEQSFALLNGACNPNGIWSIKVVDNAGAAATTGPLSNWSITFNTVNSYTYVWSPTTAMTGSTTLTPTVTPTATTTYTLTATDALGCTKSQPVTVTVNNGPTALATTIVNASCGNTDGSVTLGAVTGGTAPYTYSFDGSSFSAVTSYTGLIPKTYPIIVKDANGCTYTTSATVINMSGPTALATTIVNSSCGGSNGSITLGAVTGGTGPYTYSFNASPFTSTISYTGLLAGTYTIIVKDANGCTFTLSQTVIDNPGPTALASTVVNSNCGAADGSITLGAVTGGTAAYTYSFNGSPFTATTSYPNLLAGSYTIIVKDANGCTFTINPTVNDNPGPTGLAATVVNSSCGAADGSITLGAVTGGSAAYTYSFNGSPFTATTSYTGLLAGSYTIIVKDANGCTFTINPTVIDNAGVTAVATTMVNSNCGNADGSITIGAVTGGTAPYTYSFNGSPFTATTLYTGLIAGSYTIIVKDANGCTFTKSVTVIDNPGPTAVVLTTTNSNCGAADGSVTIGAVTGGTAPYTFSFNGGGFGATLTYGGLLAGSYPVIVKDANGCTFNASATVIDNPGPTAVVLTTVNSNCGAADGVVNIGAVTGGTAPYTYSFNGSAFTAALSYPGLLAGSYPVIVKDANGCTFNASATVIDNPGPTAIATTLVDATCGTANGSVTLGAVTGGTGPYMYSFNGSAYTAATSYTGLAAGSYTVDVKDANGCIYSTTVSISNLGGPTAIATTIVDTNCGGSTGSVTLGAVTGGTAPYTYSFNGSAYTSTTSYTGLIAGTYTIDVKGANGCLYSTSVTIIDNPGPTAIATTIVDETCGAANGSITLGAVTGGTAPYTYSFNGSPYTTTLSYTGLVAGSYTIDVKDANGCIYNTTVTVVNLPGVTNIATVIVDENCGAANGSVTLGAVTGGTAPYTYSFNGSAYTTTTTYSGLTAGSYTIDVKDANGCIYNTTVNVLNSGAPTAIATTVVDEACGAADGSVTLGAVTGGTAPYTYSFNSSAYTGTTFYGGLVAGTYTIDVKDANGCIYSTSVTINNSGGVTAIATTIVNETCGSANGSVTLGAVTGGTAPYTYSFNGSAYTATTTYSGLAAGTYTIDVKDANGCIYSTSVTITNAPAITAIVTTLVNEGCSLANGSVSIDSVTGGTAPYTYSFNGSAYSATTLYSGLVAGTYTIDVKGANGCMYSTSVSITNTPGPTAIAMTVTNAACGASDGSVSLGAVTGGTAPYTYSFNGSGYTGSTLYSGLAAGSYTLDVKDVNGCLYSTIISISNTGGPTAIASTLVNETCGSSNGSVSLGAVTAGTAPYTYSFNGSAYTGTTLYGGLAAGTYSIDVKDASGCIYSTSVTLTNAPGATAIAATVVDSTCGASNGSITLGAVTGGTAPYTYSFNGSAYTATTTYSGLAAGTYTIDVKDANGCIYSTSITITTTVAPTAAISYAGTPFCNLTTTPQPVTLTGTGVFTGGTYTSAPGLTIAAATGDITPSTSTPGTYTVTYTIPPTGGCGAIIATTSVTVDPALSPTITCGPSTTTSVQFDWTAVTGATGYSVSYQINSGSATPVTPIGNVLTYSVTGLAPADTVTIFVTPTGAGGTCLTFSSQDCTASNCTPASANISYASPFCISTATPQTVTLTGTGAYTGGTYSGPGGLSINTANGSITPSASIAGTYMVTYFVPSSGGCPSITATTSVTINALPVAMASPSSQTICSGSTTGIALSSSITGTTFTWTVVQNNVTGATPGSGSNIAQTLTATGTGATATYTITPTANGCAGADITVVVTVNQAPTATATPASQAICSGQATGITLTSNLAGTTYSWTVTQSGGASGATNGTGNIISQVLSTTGPGLGTVIYTVTPTGSTCVGAPITVNITVTPPPSATATPPSEAICSGGTTNIALTGSIPGTIFTWNVVQTNVSGGSNGTGNVIAQTLSTLGNSPGEAVYVITPTMNGCPGAPITVVVTVKPNPTATANPTMEILCSGETTGISLSSNVPGTTFTWSSIASAGISGNGSGTGNFIAETLTIIGSAQGTVDYTITPMANSCPGNPIQVTVTVKARPEVFGSPGGTICSGDTTSITLSPSIPGTSFAWTVAQTGVSGGQPGTGSTINQILITTGTVSGTATYTVTPTANGCSGDPIDIVVIVNPAPMPTLTDGIICIDQSTGNSFTTYTLDTGLSNSAYNFVWYLNNVIVPGAVNSTHDATLSGTYSVQATDATTGCVSQLAFATVTESYPGTNIAVTTSAAFTYNPTITVDVTPTPNPNYLYSLDDGPLQESNVFTPVSPGIHTIHVSDINGCTDLTANAFVIGYPHYFTPNGDGINDTWNIIGLEDPNTKIYIYDRYGKLIKQISPTGDGWDGTYNGEVLPSTDYWFTVDYIELGGAKLFKAHFSLKR